MSLYAHTPVGMSLQAPAGGQAKQQEWLARLVGFFLVEDCVDRTAAAPGGLQVQLRLQHLLRVVLPGLRSCAKCVASICTDCWCAAPSHQGRESALRLCVAGVQVTSDMQDVCIVKAAPSAAWRGCSSLPDCNYCAGLQVTSGWEDAVLAIRAATSAAAEDASPASLLAFKDAVLLACSALGERMLPCKLPAAPDSSCRLAAQG